MMAVKVLKRRQKTRMTLSKLLGVGRTMIDNYLQSCYCVNTNHRKGHQRQHQRHL